MSQRGRAVVPVLALALVAGQFESAFAGDRVIVDQRQKGYRLRVTGAWTVEKLGWGEDSAIALADPYCYITVMVAPASGVDRVTEALLDELYKEGKKGFVTSKVLKRKIETHRGKPSGWVEFTGANKEQPEVPFRCRYYVTLHRDKLYFVAFVSPVESWEKAWPLGRRVVQSMEFL